MEDNIAQALRLAAFTLMFVLALAIAISSFSLANTTLKYVLESSDRETDSTYIATNIDDNGNAITKRIVSIETILPTVMRAYVENYKIYFYDKNGDPITLYSYRTDGGDNISRNYIDLEAQTLGNDEQVNIFINGILYGKNYLYNQVSAGTLSIAEVDAFENNLRIIFTDYGIYDIIKDMEFEEFLGEYYQDDLIVDGVEIDTSSVPEVNKTKKRIITYVETL